MCLFKFIKVQLIFILSLFCVFNTSNARQPGTPDNPRPEPIFCSKGYWGQPNCNNNNFNVCSSNSNTQLNNANNNLLGLKEEKTTTPNKMNSCMKELVILINFESDKRSLMVESLTKINNLKKNLIQIGRIQKNQESYFSAIEIEMNQLDAALPEIAVHLNNLIQNQNTKIDLIINDYLSQLELTKDQNEFDRIEMEIEILKNLRIIQSKMSSNDPAALNNLIKDALYGEGDKKLKAISSLDPLTYLVFKTLFSRGLTSSGAVGVNELQDQMLIIKNDMRKFIINQNSELVLEAQKSTYIDSKFDEASTNRKKKENECINLEERNNNLPKLMNDATIEIATAKNVLTSCNSFCINTWVPAECTSR